MPKSIDGLILTQVNWKVHPAIKQAIERYAADETRRSGSTVYQITIILRALNKDKGFQKHLKAVMEEYDTTRNPSGAKGRQPSNTTA